MRNILQKLVSDISGYDPNGNGARNDHYYALSTKEDKLEMIFDYADRVMDYLISTDMAEAVYNFIETDFSNEQERFYAYITLSAIWDKLRF